MHTPHHLRNAAGRPAPAGRARSGSQVTKYRLPTQKRNKRPRRTTQRKLTAAPSPSTTPPHIDGRQLAPASPNSLRTAHAPEFGAQSFLPSRSRVAQFIMSLTSTKYPYSLASSLKTPLHLKKKKKKSALFPHGGKNGCAYCVPNPRSSRRENPYPQGASALEGEHG